MRLVRPRRFRLRALALTSSMLPHQVEGLLGQIVDGDPDRISWKPAMVSRSGTYLPATAGELLGDEERLRQEALDLARARHGQLVVLADSSSMPRMAMMSCRSL